MSSSRGVAATLLCLFAAAGIYLFTNLHVDRDFVAFLPQGGDASQRFLASQLRDGVGARLVLIRVSGADTRTLASASEALRSVLAADRSFDYVTNGSLAAGMRDLPQLHAARYRLSPDAAQHMTKPALREAIGQRFAALSGDMALLEKRFVADDPTGETLALLGSLQSGAAPRRIEGVWFDASGSGAMLLAQTHGNGSDATEQARAVGALDAAFAKVGTARGLHVEYSSAGFLAAGSATGIAREAERVSLLAAAGITLVLFAVYRSLAIVALCALPALAGLVAGLCAVTASFGNVHAITLAFGTTLLGEAVDYPSYVLTRVSAAGHLAAVQPAVRRPFVLAVLTTACGALAFLGSGVAGLVQLGVMTSCGVVVAGMVAWWAVPALAPRRWHFAAPFALSIAAPGAPRVALRCALALAISLALLAFAAGGSFWDDDPARMSPVSPAAIRLDQALRKALGAPDAGRFALVRAGDVQAVLERTERLRPVLDAAVAAGNVAGYDLVTQYMPSIATQAARMRALPSAEELRANLDFATSGSAFRANVFEPFLSAVASAREAPPLVPASLAGTGMGLRIDSLLGHDATGYWSIVPLRAVTNPDALRAALQAYDPATGFFDLRAQTASLFAQFRARTVIAMGVSILALVLILGMGLRSLRAAAMALIPSVAGAAWAALAVVAFGGGLTIFHLIALMLVIGIGVNYALFLQNAVSRAERAGSAVTTIAVVSSTTCVAFGAMALSSIPVLHAMGITVLAGTLGTLAACALLFGGSRPARGVG